MAMAGYNYYLSLRRYVIDYPTLMRTGLEYRLRTFGRLRYQAVPPSSEPKPLRNRGPYLPLQARPSAPPHRWQKYLALTAAAMALSACASTSPINCGQIPQYSSLEQSVLADELPADGPQSQVVIEDYFKLRATCDIH